MLLTYVPSHSFLLLFTILSNFCLTVLFISISALTDVSRCLALDFQLSLNQLYNGHYLNQKFIILVQ